MGEGFGIWIRRWMVSWGQIIDGLCGVVTLAAWKPDLGYKAAILVARHRAKLKESYER